MSFSQIGQKECPHDEKGENELLTSVGEPLPEHQHQSRYGRKGSCPLEPAPACFPILSLWIALTTVTTLAVVQAPESPQPCGTINSWRAWEAQTEDSPHSISASPGTRIQERSRL